MPQGGIAAAHSTNKNSHVISHSGVPAHKGKKSAVKPLVTSDSDQSFSDEETSVQLRILQQLKKVNSR